MDLARRLEKARIQLEESHADKNVARFARLEEEYRELGRIRGRVRGANAHRRPRPGERSPGAAGARALGRGASPARARAHPVRRERPADAGRADEPPGRRREALADEVPGVLPRRADRGEPRPQAARRLDHADPARRPRTGRRVPGNVLAVPQGAFAEDEIRLRALAGRQEQEIRRLKTAGRLDARPDRQARAEGQDARHARREARGQEGRGSGARATGEVPVPRAAAQRQGDAGREGAGEELRRSAGLRGRLVRRGARRAAPDHGIERRRARPACSASWRGSPRPIAERSAWGTGSRSATTRRSTRASATACR